MVCREDFEQRHPQDLLKVQREKIAVPWSRPYPAEDNYIPENLWTKPEDHLGIVEINAMDVVKRIYDNYASSGALNGYALNTYSLNETLAQEDPSETFVLSETFQATLGRYVDESIAATETFAKAFGKTITETLSLSDSYYLAEVERSGDSLSFAETQRFTMLKAIPETLAITENVSYLLVSPPDQFLDGAALNSTYLG